MSLWMITARWRGRRNKMYAHGFLCGVAVTLMAVTVALLIAEAVLKRKLRDMKKRTVREAGPCKEAEG